MQKSDTIDFTKLLQVVDLLYDKTADFKLQYLNKTQDWAEWEFERICKQHEEYLTHVGKPTTRYWELERWAYRVNPRRIRNNGVEVFIANELKKAKRHYQQSIAKLSERILQKQLDVNNLTITSTHLDVNFEAVITDGVKTVTATTIIACGPIKRPHYRYLVR